MTQNFHILSKITAEPPSLPPLSHANAHILNTPLLERKFARAYLADPESREAVDLRKQIVKGAREALEEQYWHVIDRAIHARPNEARLGGDPSVSNKIRSFVGLMYYDRGEWHERIEVGLYLCYVLDKNLRRGSPACGWPTTMGDAVLPRPYWSPRGSVGGSNALPASH